MRDCEKRIKDTCRQIIEKNLITVEQICSATDQDIQTVQSSLTDDATPLTMLTILAIAQKTKEPLVAIAHELGHFVIKHPPMITDVDKFDQLFLSSVSQFNQLSSTMRRALDNGDIAAVDAGKIAKQAADVLLVAGSIYSVAKKRASEK
jgi:hypothetical protein